MLKDNERLAKEYKQHKKKQNRLWLIAFLFSFVFALICACFTMAYILF
ncbi:hypothetical protein [Helicobacter cetorum]|nr:hypothetical protein [Helicobacter cetorum]